jgi:hypothetical protein
MAISGQANINIANTPNQPLGSDSLFTAFNTVQNNFTTLFQASSPITSLTAGPGITVSNSTIASYQIINTGVTSLIAGNNITITSTTGTPSSNGALIISATGGNGGGGGVTSVGVVSNTLSVTNTPIISTGNIRVELANIANLTAGTYRNPNLAVDSTGRIISIANGGTTGVTSVGLTAGAGISVSGSPVNGNSGNGAGSGNITVTNTGVTSLIAGTGIILSGSTGAVTISSTGGGGGGTGTVTSVSVSSNTLTVSGSPVVSAGTITVDLPSSISVANVTASNANLGNILSANVVVSTTDATPMIVSVSSNSGFSVQHRRSRGTVGSPLPVVTGDLLMAFRARGYSNFNTYQLAGQINIAANGAPADSTSLVPSDVFINATSTSNRVSSFKLTNNGNSFFPGTIAATVLANTAPITTEVAARARGANIDSPANIETGDYLYRLTALGYTSNGQSNVNNITGYAYAGGIEVVAAGLPGSSGAYVPSNVIIRSISTSNNQNIFNFTASGNLEIPGVYQGNGSGLTSIAGANVTGAVAFATTANAVAGANVTGTVANATYAATAGSATTATSATSASTSGTVTTAAQPNITSVGTLASLSVSGTITGNAAGLTNIPAANLSGNVNNNIAVTATANTTANVGNIVSLVINGVTYQLLAV